MSRDINISDISASEQQTSFLNSERSSDKATAVTIRMFRNIQELDKVREIWNLWCDDPAADMDFFLSSALTRPDFIRPHVIVVYRNGLPDCMLVGRLERSRLKLKVGYTILFRPTAKQLSFLQGGVLGNASAENCRLLAHELKRNLQDREADVVELTRVTNDSDLYRAALSRFGFFSRGHFSPVHEHRWLSFQVPLKNFFKGYRARIGMNSADTRRSFLMISPAGLIFTVIVRRKSSMNWLKTLRRYQRRRIKGLLVWVFSLTLRSWSRCGSQLAKEDLEAASFMWTRIRLLSSSVNSIRISFTDFSWGSIQSLKNILQGYSF